MHDPAREVHVAPAQRPKLAEPQARERRHGEQRRVLLARRSA
jgi:hypothetical protein